MNKDLVLRWKILQNLTSQHLFFMYRYIRKPNSPKNYPFFYLGNYFLCIDNFPSSSSILVISPFKSKAYMLTTYCSLSTSQHQTPNWKLLNSSVQKAQRIARIHHSNIHLLSFLTILHSF